MQVMLYVILYCINSAIWLCIGKLRFKEDDIGPAMVAYIFAGVSSFLLAGLMAAVVEGPPV